jgi:hypothetical protein
MLPDWSTKSVTAGRKSLMFTVIDSQFGAACGAPALGEPAPGEPALSGSDALPPAGVAGETALASG